MLNEKVEDAINRAFVNGFDLLDSLTDAQIAQDLLTYNSTFERENIHDVMNAVSCVRTSKNKAKHDRYHT